MHRSEVYSTDCLAAVPTTLIAWLMSQADCLAGLQGRKLAEIALSAQRVGRLADQAGGGSMVTSKSLASYDGEEDEGEVLQRLNVILKVRTN